MHQRCQFAVGSLQRTPPRDRVADGDRRFPRRHHSAVRVRKLAGERHRGRRWRVPGVAISSARTKNGVQFSAFRSERGEQSVGGSPRLHGWRVDFDRIANGALSGHASLARGSR